MNLLLNARDAILQQDARTEPGLIEVSLESTLFGNDQGLLLKVRDNGPGVPRDSQDKIFTPFYTTKREAGGTGLGLPVSLGLIQKHRGKLEVSSDGKRWKQSWQAPSVKDKWMVNLPDAPRAQYIKLGLQRNGTLHLGRVTIFGESASV